VTIATGLVTVFGPDVCGEQVISPFLLAFLFLKGVYDQINV
jgi:hypothetical protein